MSSGGEHQARPAPPPAAPNVLITSEIADSGLTGLAGLATAVTGRDPGDTRWFVTLAVWKLAVLLEASYHRWLAGMSEDPFFATLDTGVPALLARAREVAGA